MQAVGFPSFNKYKSQKVNWLQPKFDGHLAEIIKGRDGRASVYTKNKHDVSDKYFNVPHIREILEGLPVNTQVFAELHHPDKFATDVPTLLNAADPDLKLTAFAVPRLYGADLRNYLLDDAMDFIGRYMEAAQWEKFRGKADEQMKNYLLKRAESEHLEGYVLKREHMAGWYKLKPVDDLDAFVTSTKTSTSLGYYGQLKSVRAGVWKDKPVGGAGGCDSNREIYDLGDVPGFKEKDRWEFNTPEKRAALVGRVLRVKYSGLAAKGKLKWPHFAGWRTDKDKDQCTYSQVE